MISEALRAHVHRHTHNWQCLKCSCCCAHQIGCYKCLSRSPTLLLPPPKFGLPHVTTLPFATIAAKANRVAWICWTFLSWSLTLVLSPPLSGTPYVTTLSSAKIAAKAAPVAWICWTFQHSWADRRLCYCCRHLAEGPMWPSCHLQRTTKTMARCVTATLDCCATAVMLSPLWRPESWRVCVGFTGRPSGAASLRKGSPKDCCAFIFKSKTVLVIVGPSDRATHRPLGNDTFSCSCSILFILKPFHLVLSGSIANVANSL